MATIKKTAAELKSDATKLIAELDLLEREAKGRGLMFSRLTEEQLIKKLSGETANSPFIIGQSWTSGTTPGSPASYSVTVHNPDPFGYDMMFASIFFGLFNFLPAEDIGEGIAGYLPAWPYMSTPPFSVASGTSTTKSFSYITPTSMPRSTYTGNAIIWYGNYHDTGVYYDRSLFQVTLS